MFNIKKRIIQKIKYELGIDKLETANDSMLHVLNYCIDITQLPPTKDPDLRILQKCDTVLLAIFDKLCKKYGLTYWLNYGTLLGAYRHKGFIPWDDDMDVSVPREDLDKIMSLMKSKIEELGLSIRYADEHPLRCLILGFNEEKTGIWVDLFPADTYITGANEAQLHDTMKRYKQFYNNNIHFNSETLKVKKNELINNLPKGDKKYILSLCEGWMGEPCMVYEYSDIFPLTTINFENYDFYAPNNVELLLEKRYGKTYMSFPRNAMNNHGRLSDITISQRAKTYGMDMNDVYNYLQSIYEHVNEG